MTLNTDAAPLLLAALSAGSLLVYALLDGRDLGIGILYPLVARRTDIGTLFDSLAPFWDANGIWLVLSAVSLATGFPIAGATFVTQLCLPSAIIAACFVARAVAYRFQRRGRALPRLWQWTFSSGSILAALCQGWIFGCIIEAISPAGDGGLLWTTSRALLPLVCAVGVLGAYALLGSGWLILKTGGSLQVLGREVGLSALILAGASLIPIWVWMLIAHSLAVLPWSSSALLSALLMVFATACGLGLKKSLWAHRDGWPFFWTTGLIATAYMAIATNALPLGLPEAYAAAAATSSRRPGWIAVVIILPLAMFQLALALRTCQGKLSDGIDQDAASMPHIGARRTSGQQADLHLS